MRFPLEKWFKLNRFLFSRFGTLQSPYIQPLNSRYQGFLKRLLEICHMMHKAGNNIKNNII